LYAITAVPVLNIALLSIPFAFGYRINQWIGKTLRWHTCHAAHLHRPVSGHGQALSTGLQFLGAIISLTEMKVKQYKNFVGTAESDWSFGQTLAILTVSFPVILLLWDWLKTWLRTWLNRDKAAPGYEQCELGVVKSQPEQSQE
jgi:hypothetical protein